MPGPEQTLETMPERKVTDYANDIRNKFRASVEKLPFFPRCYEYMAGDNPLYIWNQTSDSKTRDIVILHPDGSITKGPARIHEESDHTKLEYRTDFQKPASDLEVIMNGPALIDALYRHIVDEIPDQTDSDVIEKTLTFLANQKRGETIHELAFMAKKLIFGKGYEIEATHFDKSYHEAFARYDEVFSYLKDRDNLVSEAKRLSDEQAVDPIDAFISGLVRRMHHDGLLTRDMQRVRLVGEGWIYTYAGACINPESETVMYWDGKNLVRDPIREIQEARFIVGEVIDKVVKSAFPKLGEEPEKPAF